MPTFKPQMAVLLVLAVGLAACGETSRLRVADGMGPTPMLPEPNKTLIPTVNIAPAVGWPQGAKPIAAPGTQVSAFAEDLDHPRWLYVLPNGDVLVAETNSPAKPDDSPGIRGWIMRKVMGRAGAGVPSANRITLLRDSNHDGIAETRTVFLKNLNSPFGMALVGNDFYVADTDKLLRYHYENGQTSISGEPTTVTDLPAGTINHHWTKNVIASKDGKKLYVTVGSNSNVGENGLDKEQGRASIWEVDAATGAHRIFASGLRNPNGMDWEPQTGKLWTAVNERDEIGSDLVPDYVTSVKDGAFYGWPFSYYGQHVDVRVKPQNPQRVAEAIPPDYAVGPHTASLGMTFADGKSLPAPFNQGMFIGQHGSWNRNPHSGYKVLFVPFANGVPTGTPIDLLSGFLNADDNAQGRPVGVINDQHGGLLVADDVGNKIWRVTAAP
ncbi:sorbosone dehydrogenase family protein [Pseudomonas sp. CCI3.2]|uniref:PQQ-dependent sugar dehydrogenase n=1 Tax=unclassified Pseudomonas TaxID=196821 RepID=UPI002AC9D8F9|nr:MULTISPECIES: sorbosone dehydrogenase family protein [unclassified Pseudomonas]MEB0075879.1 sorbosone dehydrogenase family protein [Pseudomonas sp. MH10out]MEB0104368.1 sorbosone dehydrogenase family protein [Pseudomonas sp. CCI3.2]MEB0131633.1 sorbosone dehydrogenase family protein [Pseudomonas sp. CCI2.4]MEB0156526.1 sorbosone dehydrogenase family protein [Pseudomonas sp. AH2 (2023)]MEB0166460.1 sorbosone dehydrogenase family protein [Pseudomonas sp. CCC4.4]